MDKVIRVYELILRNKTTVQTYARDAVEARKNAVKEFDVKDSDIMAVYRKGLN